MVNFKTMDGNEAVGRVAYKFSEVCGIYPITPASPMAEHVDEYASHGEFNYFGNTVNVVEMQSEAGAIATVHGALQSGVLSTTFTASQGLLLMIPSLYKMAGEMLPGVVHVAARSLATHALSIFGDHQDVYAARSTGVCMLASSSVQEAYYMAAITHLSAIKSSLPFIHFFDGFRTSHEIDKIKLMDMDRVSKLIDREALEKFRAKRMDIGTATTRGTAENDDVYFQHSEARNKYYEKAIDNVVDIMNKMNELNGTDIRPFNYYGDIHAKYVIVAMGSVNNTIKEVIDVLNRDGRSCGLVEVHLFRPFSKKYLNSVIPSSALNMAVIDRAKDIAALGEPLYLDVTEALAERDIKIVGGRYGLSSKNTTPRDIKAIYDMLESDELKNNFTVGIVDDVTNLSLNVDKNFNLSSDDMEILIYGYGSDGMVSTSKDLIKIIGDNTDKYVQGYFQYDSKKSGGVTRSHIRISDKEIRKSYYVENPDLIVVSKDSYMYQYDILDNIKDGGTLLLNTNLSEDNLIKSLPKKVKYLLAAKKVKFYIIDAYSFVNSKGLRNKISTCMEVCIFDILKVLKMNDAIDIMKKSNKKRFSSKGSNIVSINNELVDEAVNYVNEVSVDETWINLDYQENNHLTMINSIRKLKGDSLPVSAFIDRADGIFEGGNTKTEKRDIAERVPCWKSDNCIQCNNCVFVCPHAVIRPFLTNKEDDKVESIPSIFPRDVNYSIAVSYEDCTGCGLCSQVCPGKMGKKAIEMEDYDRNKFKQETFDYLLENNVNAGYKPKMMNVKNVGFVEPKFEFSGSCAGCGETPYLKNLTQMFSNNLMIANATGCSSIYGASMPSMPYSIPWANSLFEDNAEFGLGIYKGIEVQREKIFNYMLANLDKEPVLFKEWLDNRNNYDICMDIYRRLDYSKYQELAKLKSYIIPHSMWIVGGDGFAYDIGYSGLDHVISRDDNVNILVLDTEVYSNTGGQASKSSNHGAIAQFASNGKSSYKKDLARIAMCYPNCYVACVNIGYDREQYLRALKEANEHNGPSLIIAYSPCIEHGIKKGMEYSLLNSSLATECGYFLTFRYKPSEEKLYLDSKDVNFSKYSEFLSGENRYVNLKRVNPEHADRILAEQKDAAVKRFNYYKKLSED